MGQKYLSVTILGVLSCLLSTMVAFAQGAPNYVPGTRLEGEFQSFGKWQFTISSLTRDDNSIRPQTNIVEVCLKKGMDQAIIPFTPKPEKGRCVISGNRFARDDISIDYKCDEGEEIYSGISFYLEHKEDGVYEGRLDYTVAPLNGDYRLNAISHVSAKRLGDCEE